MTDIYSFKMEDIDGELVDFENFKGKVLLIVNTASKCGHTPQYEGLEKLYEDYKDQGLVVLGFPCGQFLGQEFKEADQIKSFCQVNYGVTFPLFKKIKVNGKEEEPLYTYLKDQAGGGRIKWNFTKFLIDRDGRVVDRFEPKEKPESFEEDIKKLL